MKEKYSKLNLNWLFYDITKEKVLSSLLALSEGTWVLYLNQDANMSVMDHATKFKELVGFTFEFMAMDKMKKNSFEKWLDPKILNHLVGHHITTYGELCDWAFDVKRATT